jgi:hypothetical protein
VAIAQAPARLPMSASTRFASYSAFGMRIESQVCLPLPEADESAELGWTILWSEAHEQAQPTGVLINEERCEAPCHSGDVVTRAYRSPTGSWIWSIATGWYYVTPDARRVVVFPNPDADERAIALALIGRVANFVLFQLGHPSLHASGVLLNGEIVAFLGPPGTGKSTMAGYFLRHGETLHSDDVLPLEARPDGVYGLPGVPMMKVWSGTATHTLGIASELPDLTDTITKKLLRLEGRYQYSKRAARLRAIYLLQRYDSDRTGERDVAIVQPSQRDMFRLLLRQSPCCELLFPSEAARLLPLYTRLMAQAPLRILRIPNGFQHQEAVRQTVLSDLEAHR